MDDSLHCNWLKCRKSLVVQGKAVVTTCSHIFCVSCAENLFTADKACPACKTILDQPDDVVLSSLNPSIDYRTSVLAGLAPDIIIDIASRSLGFWTYQQSQEAAFQRMMYQAATERNTLLEKRVQSILVEANGEIQLLQQKINGLDKEIAGERRRARELQEALRAATKDYERLKLRIQQEQRRKSSGGPPTGPARPLASITSATQQFLANRVSTSGHGHVGGNGNATTNFWQANSRSFVPPSPTRGTSTVDEGTAANLGGRGGLPRTEGVVSALFNHAAEPSSQHDRFNPGTNSTVASPKGSTRGQAVTSGFGTRGSSASPPSIKSNGVQLSSGERQLSQHQSQHTVAGRVGQHSVFGQYASPSLGHIQPVGATRGSASLSRAASKLPETPRALRTGEAHRTSSSHQRREGVMKGEGMMPPQSHTSNAFRLAGSP